VGNVQVREKWNKTRIDSWAVKRGGCWGVKLWKSARIKQLNGRQSHIAGPKIKRKTGRVAKNASLWNESKNEGTRVPCGVWSPFRTHFCLGPSTLVSNLTREIVQEFVAMSFLLSFFDLTFSVCVCEILGAPFLFFGDFRSLLHSFSDAKGENCSGSVFFLTRSTGGNLYCYHVATPPKTYTHTHIESVAPRRSYYLRIC